MNKMSEVTIEECKTTTEELLIEHWNEIQSLRHQNPKEKIKISVDFNLEFKGDEQLLRTSIGFGMRKTDHRDRVINPNQMDLPLNPPGKPPNGDGPGDAGTGVPVESSVPAKKRARRGAKAQETAV